MMKMRILGPGGGAAGALMALSFWTLIGSASATVIELEAGRWDVEGVLEADGVTIGADAVLAGGGTVMAPTTVSGALDPDGTLSFNSTVTFSGGVLFSHASDNTTLDGINAIGAITGTATVQMTRAETAFPTQQVVIAGSAASDYAAFAVQPFAYWTKGTSGSLDFWVNFNDVVIAPESGPLAGGTTITVTNGNFGVITNILVGGVSVAPEDSGTNWFIVVMPVSGASGPVDLIVQTSDHGNITLTSAFTYNPAGEIGGTNENWNAWTPVAGLPAARQGAGYAAMGDYLYAIGGTEGSGPRTNVFRFDGTQWTDVVGFSATLEFPPVAVLDGLIYLFRYVNTASTETHRFDGNAWSLVAGGGQVYGVARRSAGTLDTNIFVSGGYLLGYQNNVTRFDGSTMSAATALPVASDMAACATLNDRLYRMGGSYSDGILTNVYSFDGTNWAEVAGLPSERYGSGAATFNGHIYLVGGMSDFFTAHTNVYRFDGTNWMEIAGLPTEQGWLGAGVLNDVLYAVGGSTGAYNSVTNAYRYPGLTVGSGVAPESGSVAGGFQVTINGLNLGNGTDITNVTLCGVAVTNIASQSATQVVVWAGLRGGGAATGDVVVFSTSYGITTKANGFSYTGQTTQVVLYDFYMQEVNGGISVCWRTASEDNTVGFDLYRWQDGAWLKVNVSLIPGTGEMGGSYSIADPGANTTDVFRYKLVETETEGEQVYEFADVSVRNPRMENLSVTPDGIVLRWLSREQDTYEVQKSLDMGAGFESLATGLPATPPVNVYTDQVESANGAFYRVRVEE